MPITTSKLNVTELDFEQIKSNLKTFLRSQTELTDYDFEGSALSVIVDLLSYNTHYMAFYLNMVANEMFLDSATNRDSVVSLAKSLGYVPKSKTGASATVTLNITKSSPDTNAVTIPQYTTFTTVSDGVTYTFYTLKDYVSSTVTASSQSRTITNVSITEGKKYTHEWTANTNNLEQRFIIPNVGVDTSTLVVKIKDNPGSGTSTLYTKYDNIESLTSTSTVYFLQEAYDEKYEIYFGDGVFGKSIQDGNIIEVTYLTSNGADANNLGRDDSSTARTYTASSVSGVSSIDVAVNSVASGGAEIQSVSNIKFNSPKWFQTQGRAVTADDYKSIVLAEFANADSVVAYGGELSDPPQYGKVFIVVKPKSGLTLTSGDKLKIENTILKSKKVASIIPEVLDPDYTYVNVDSTVKYNPNISTNPEGTIQNDVVSSISNYSSGSLSSFDSAFRYSKLVADIDSTDNAIVSNNTKIKLRKSITPNTDSSLNDTFTLKYSSNLIKGGLSSDTFNIYNNSTTLAFGDDSLGTVFLYDTDVGRSSPVVSNAGTIDYLTGKVSISAINIETIISGNTFIDVYTEIDEIDVNAAKGQILKIESSDISVTMDKEVV
tara:strand:- start:504 stop:2315 length:1812 start_codon:yes stop_codon:yes gene_type:complete